MSEAGRLFAISIALLTAGCSNITADGASCDSVEVCPTGYFCDPSGHCASGAPVVDSGFTGSGFPDSGTHDAGAVDSGPVDSGAVDSGAIDSGPADSGPQDAGAMDAGRQDAGTMDAGRMDAGPSDAGPPDAGHFDAGSRDAGSFYCSDGMTSDGGDIGHVNCPSGEICALNGHCEFPAYMTASGVTLDEVTGLYWQQGISPTPCPVDGGSGLCDWTQAINYCSQLALVGGGWRLPKLDELYSLVEVGGDSSGVVSIDTNVFSNTTATYFWTEDPDVQLSTSAWWVYFGGNSNDGEGNKTTLWSVRCVR